MWGLLESPSVLLLRLDLLVLEGRNREQVLEEEVEEDERIKLQVAVIGALERLLRNLDHDLRDVEPLMRDELGLHFLGLRTVVEGLRVSSRLLLVRFGRELVNGLARAALNKVAGESFEDLVRLHPDVRLAVLQDQQEHVLEVMVRDQIGKHPYVGLGHQSQ